MLLTLLFALLALPGISSSSPLLRFVNQSPNAPNVDSWLALFSPQAQVSDPVYLPPHQGEAQLRRFHQTFIASNNITFVVLKDFVDTASNRVVRLVNISIQAKGSDVGIFMPTHIVYQIDGQEASQWKISSLRAHWTALCVRFKGEGLYAKLATLGFLATNTQSMLVHQGLSFSLRHWFGALIGIVSLGSRAVGQLLTSATHGDENQFIAMFASANDKSVLLAGRRDAPATLFDKWNGSKFDIVDYQQSGFYASVYYHRKTQAGQEYEGFFVADLEEWTWRTPRVEHMYLVEEKAT